MNLVYSHAVQESIVITHHVKRPGFTLVELLVVIVILGLLVAFLLPAIMGAIGAANLTRGHAEINELSLALEKFKDQFGIYPPSRIRLKENQRYDLTDAFDAHSFKYLRKIWPQIAIEPGTGTSATTFNWFDDGSTTSYELEGDECLVFFLGGIAQPQTGGIYATYGFSADPENPSGVPVTSTATSLSRVGPFYNFDAGRLYQRTATDGPIALAAAENDWDFGATDPRPTTKLPSYRALESEGPYAYFSSYEGRGYRPYDCELGLASNGDIPLAFFQMTWPNISTANSGSPPTVHASDCFAPNPLTETDHAPTGGEVVRPFNPNTYQIISPGEDGLFGRGGQFGASTGSSDPNGVDDLSNVAPGMTIGNFAAERNN
ncbi:Type II secretion system protein G precursor [Planctomycetes bacterium Pan216]|uniref:Type II secretion system protein G n=1 Tax=Kolteria novifilia TaxID=2527975 RepID=A0A518AZY6_9BACT|nr:Type II secretion system protein G precursor [Planctomycetes bacterium Pan216]